ncbi:MAG: hypothetical protein AB7F59_12140 [Bdellovibrionales bacterium]
MIPLRIHNVIDYIAGAFLLLCPVVFGFSHIEVANNVFMFSGAALIGYSLLTKYRYSLLKLIPVKAHMVLDVLIGIAVMLSPWAFGYAEFLTTTQYSLHFVSGIAVILLVAFTDIKFVSAETRLEAPPNIDTARMGSARPRAM